MELSERNRSLSVPTLLYIPVLHNGYMEFFSRHADVSDVLWIIGEDLVSDFSSLHTEIRAMQPFLIKKMIEALNLFGEVRVLSRQSTPLLSTNKLLTVSENISTQVVKKYFPEAELVVDTVFLRYDESNVKSLKPVNYDRESTDLFDSQMMELAMNEAEKSSDWWRHVGAVLVKERQVIATAHNHPVPSEHMPYILGNPRDFIEAGKLSHFSDGLHSEDGLFAQLLTRGISTFGADIYVSVFPCPRCAKLIAYSGFKRCFFGSGHASLDGESVLRSKGVEMIYIPLQPRV